MRYFVFFVVLIVSIGAVKAQDFDSPYIRTKAVVEVEVDPDEIYLDILTREESNITDLLALETTMLNKLNKLGIDTDKDFKVDALGSIQASKILGTSVKFRRKYQLKVSSVNEVVAVIMTLNELKIRSVSLSRVDYSKADELLLKMRRTAVEKAKIQAQILLVPTNQSLGALWSIEDVEHAEKGDLQRIDSVIAGASKSTSGMMSFELGLKPIRYTKAVVVQYLIK